MYLCTAAPSSVVRNTNGRRVLFGSWCWIKSPGSVPDRLRPCQAKQCQHRPGQARSGQARSGQVRSGQVRSGQVRSGQVRPCQARPGQQHKYGPLLNLLFIDLVYCGWRTFTHVITTCKQICCITYLFHLWYHLALHPPIEQWSAWIFSSTLRKLCTMSKDIIKY